MFGVCEVLGHEGMLVLTHMIIFTSQEYVFLINGPSVKYVSTKPNTKFSKTTTCTKHTKLHHGIVHYGVVLNKSMDHDKTIPSSRFP